MSLSKSIAMILLGLIGTSCALVPVSDARSPSICAAVDARMGGCDEQQPEFAATDCSGVGREFGAYLDDRTRQIVAGPDAVEGEARSVRLRQAMVLLSARANDYLKEHGLHASCDVPEFLAAAETQFSEELRRGVEDAFYDGAPRATYDEWKRELMLMLGIIDAEESDGWPPRPRACQPHGVLPALRRFTGHPVCGTKLPLRGRVATAGCAQPA